MNSPPSFPPHTDLGGGWFLVESGYHHQGHAAVYLAIDHGRAALCDAGIGLTAPLVHQALAAHGLNPAAVDLVVISHAHLDHCAGAGHLMASLPNARLACHARASQHLADPTRLVAGARRLYGKRFDALYGQVQPVDHDRIDTVTDGSQVRVGQRELEVLHTPGHTFDHISVLDRTADCVFTGDAFGVRLHPSFGVRELGRIPAAPTQFSPADWKATVHRIAKLGVSRALVTHYGAVTDLATRSAELVDELEAFVGFARQVQGQENARALLRELIEERWHSLLGTAPASSLLEIDLLLSACGLELWTDKHLARHDG